MKRNLNLVKTAIIFACLLSFAAVADAQKRRTPARKTAATSAATVSNAADIRDGAQKVATQIKNVSKFVYVLGGVARAIEDIDKDARAGKISRATADKNEQYKQSVIQSIRNLRAGLAALETDFNAKPSLRLYNVNLQGVADLTGTAEDQANGGQFVESGKTLLLVIEKLSDTLAALP